MKCPKCKTDLRFTTNIFIDAPSRFFHKMSKKQIKDKDVQLMGVDWPRLLWYCPKGDWCERTKEL